MPKKTTDFIRLPDSELQIMQLIWEMEKNGIKDIYAGAIVSSYPETIGHLALTTILTLITRLQKKGFIKIEKRSRTNYSKPLISEEDYKRGAVEDFARMFFISSQTARWSETDTISARDSFLATSLKPMETVGIW